MNYYAGKEIQEHKPEQIAAVEPNQDGNYLIRMENGTGLILEKKYAKVVPQVGDIVVRYTYNAIMEDSKVGIKLNDQLLYFRQ